MQKLIDGIHKFQNDIVRPKREFYGRLADGQTPETLFITCSDSRVNPNLITQTQPGDLFIIRNAGNLIPNDGAPNGGEAASIEYAVMALKVRDIIICGHSHCGAVGALLHPEQVASMPRVAAWLSNAEATRQVIQQNYGHLTGAALLNAAVQENVLSQIDSLRTQPSVAGGLAAGTLRLHAWVYKVETGEVFSYDPAERQFVLLTPVRAPVPIAEGQPRPLRAI